MAPGKDSTKRTPEDVILRRRRALRDKALLSSALQKIVVIIIVIAVLFGVFFGIAPMKGNDMEPKISPGDLVLFYRMGKKYARNEIVLMKRDGKQYVGRLIGLPGDTLVIRSNGTISVNGGNVVETDIFYETLPAGGDIKYPVMLGEDQFFILADKRDTAKDSRYFGAVSGSEIKGKVVTTISSSLTNR